MSVSSYEKGRNFEWYVARDLRILGWYVVRAAKSGFPDLVAFKKGRVFGVECKFNQTPDAQAVKAVKEWNRQTEVSALLVCRHEIKGGRWITENLWSGKTEEERHVTGKRRQD